MKTIKTNDGSYTSSFFIVEHNLIGQDSDLQTILSSPITVHELLHFIQDVSTLIGLANLNRNAKLIAHYHTATREGKKKLPYRPTDEISVANRDLFSFYLQMDDRQYKQVPKEISLEAKKDLYEINVSGRTMTVNHHTVNLNYQGNKQTFDFSGITIMEGMASIFERWFFPEADKNYFNLPYDLPYLVAKNKYSPILKDIRLLFALCDASLLYYDSAEAFIKILEMMAEQNVDLISYQDVYKFVCENYLIENSNVLAELKKESGEAVKSFKNIMNSSFLDYVSDWVQRTIEFYSKIRTENIGFLSDLLYMDKKHAFDIFFEMIKKNGSPVVVDGEGSPLRLVSRAAELSEKDMYCMEYLIGLRSIFESIFFSGKFSCPFAACKNGNCEKPIQTLSGNYCLYTFCKQLIKIEI